MGCGGIPVLGQSLPDVEHQGFQLAVHKQVPPVGKVSGQHLDCGQNGISLRDSTLETLPSTKKHAINCNRKYVEP